MKEQEKCLMNPFKKASKLSAFLSQKYLKEDSHRHKKRRHYYPKPYDFYNEKKPNGAYRRSLSLKTDNFYLFQGL